MLIFNKLFLALAFLGSSAAAQAAERSADVSRIDYGKTSEKPDRPNGIRRSLNNTSARSSGMWSHSLGQQPVDHVYCVTFENLSGTHNGVKVRQENLLGRYDVSLPLISTSKLLDTRASTMNVSAEDSLSLSQGQSNYLPKSYLL
ncbi:MAG TPA: hypothetical protein VGC62_14525 [Pseudomonas sp.]|uniref:hypothetical protein n=1 Tax=Pseudomonas sp. TaxID=306 RepID=UPI002EDB8F21